MAGYDHNPNKELTDAAQVYDDWYQGLTDREKQAADKAIKNVTKKLPNTGKVQAKYLFVQTMLHIQDHRIR
jgi:hypothetical protein